ncbi:MAG: translocation/assembly module TamB domain-containing protein [Chthoniobacterales bacterium]|nr:translocation/assembly module TamB domain-containing protein [Chthoniobacterales bacterium]
MPLVPDPEANAKPRRGRKWIRSTLLGLAVVFLLLALLHGPILRAVVHSVAVKVAAGRNLKLDFRVEGGVLGGITLRNVHATATGPSAVQSLNADRIHAEYSLPALAFHGMSGFLKNVEVQNVTAVLDPSKAPIPTPTPPPKPNEKVSLPTFFPERLVVNNVSLTIKGSPNDTVVKNFNIGLYPDHEGELKIDRLQIPGVNTWSDITASTTYANKNLYLHNLLLDPENKLQTVNVDASQIAQGKVALQVQGTLGGGEVASRIDLSANGSSYETRTNLHAKDISLGKLGQLLGISPGEFSGAVRNADIDLRGSLAEPSSWDGTINANIDNVRQGGFALDDIKLDAVAANGRATLKQARIDAGTNHVTLNGAIDLPKTVEGFGRTPGDFQVAIDAPDLKQLTGFLAPPATGALQANGNLKTGNGIIRLKLNAKGDLIGFDQATVKQLTATISATKKMPPPNDNGKEAAPFDQGLTSTVHAQLDEVRYGDFVIDQVAAEVKSDGANVALNPVTITRNNNVLLVHGTYTLPAPNDDAMKQPADVQFSLRAPQLSDYWQSDAANKVSGELQADGSVHVRGGVASGQIDLTGQQIAAQKLLVRQLSLQTAIAGNTVYLNDLTATLNEQDYVRANGTVKLQKPFPYTGAIAANLADLSAFAPLLAAAEKPTPLAGSLVVNWQGQGEAATFKNNGDLKLNLERGRFAEMKNLQAKVEAHYTPQQLDVPIVFVASDKVSLQSSLQAKGSNLEVSNIQIDQGTAKYAKGYASLPFVWSNLGTDRKIFPPNGKVTISFQSENLDLAKLFTDFGAKPPVSGQLSVKLDAQGPLDQIQAALDLQLQSLRADAAKQLEPASVTIGLRLQNNDLKIDGKIQQAKVQPILIAGHVPLNLSQLIAQKKIDDQTPVQAKVQMPRSSINFVREFVPALRQLDGSVALDVNVGGTVAKPALSGTADMNINVARFENATLPALTNFKALLNFRDNVLNFDRFAGDLAGGPFTLSGRISLPKLTEPNFDLRLNAKSVLVARNDDLTARVDADIKVVGPLQSASVSGEVLTTNSRFLKNIDIIPIGLPGRPAPLPEPPSSAPGLSFPDPPLRDWKFDIAIKSKDPFLIRGNLATGSAIIDMKLAGTGLHPQLQGQVRLESFEATLPFSTLTIRLGFLYFDPDDPLNPKIELRGESLIRDYTIHVYIYGTANAPQAVFSSEPPLPQEEIISLLATGTTREELTGGGNVLATRAILLLGKELYRKVFKKGGGEEPKTDSLFNRLSVEFNGADPRTGEQTATAKYKVTDRVVLVGDLGVAGGFRGQVKYLIRFR